jgi:hypothetical protein
VHNGDDGQDVDGNLLAQVLLLQRVCCSGEVRLKARGEERGGERGEEGGRERENHSRLASVCLSFYQVRLGEVR